MRHPDTLAPIGSTAASAVGSADAQADPTPSALLIDRARWPQALALRHRALLAEDASGQLLLLADREADAQLLQAAELRLGLALQWLRCSPTALDSALAEGERDGRAVDALDPPAAGGEPGAGHAHRREAQELSLGALGQVASPAVRLLDALLLDALRDGASDLHLEMQPRGAELRLRLDGVMQPLRRIDGAALAEQLVSRLKVMAELDIGERRLPQDGRFKLRAEGREVDFRLSIMPSVWGEDAVVRLLDRGPTSTTNGQHAGAPTLSSLGFEQALHQRILELARAPHGMLLVTGPTGSGKTTTLYAAISELHTGAEKIITIEDPVEYQLAGVVQIPVNDKKGLGFARGLRAMLRHDPDRVMVGEIRDAETAQIAVQAALTGHGVFSTVHANSAFEVIGRFTHMGLDLHNLVSALNAVLAQRLLRQVCGHCAQDMAPDAQHLQALADEAAPSATWRLRRGLGCAHCHHSGYRGRRAVAELLVLDDNLRDLIVQRAPLSALKQAARQAGMRPLSAAALDAVRHGFTTLQEVHRVVSLDG